MEFSRGKQLLLVLDNCEHLLEGAASARRGPAAVVRAAGDLGDQPRGPWDRGGAAGAGAAAGRARALMADLAAITEAEAVRLFAERADAVKPDFAGDRGERCGGRRGGPAAGWDSAGDRAGGGAGSTR